MYDVSPTLFTPQSSHDWPLWYISRSCGFPLAYGGLVAAIDFVEPANALMASAFGDVFFPFWVMGNSFFVPP